MEQTYQVMVPAGVKSGQTFQVNLGGQIIFATAPPGVYEGMVMYVKAPAAPKVAQAIPVATAVHTTLSIDTPKAPLTSESKSFRLGEDQTQSGSMKAILLAIAVSVFANNYFYTIGPISKIEEYNAYSLLSIVYSAIETRSGYDGEYWVS